MFYVNAVLIKISVLNSTMTTASTSKFHFPFHFIYLRSQPDIFEHQMQSNASFTKSSRFKVANCIVIYFNQFQSLKLCLLFAVLITYVLKSIRLLVHILAYFHNRLFLFFHLCGNEKGQIKLFSFGSTRLIQTSDGQGQSPFFMDIRNFACAFLFFY